MKEVKCQNGNCQNKVMIQEDAVMFGILCEHCNKTRVYAYERGRPDGKRY